MTYLLHKNTISPKTKYVMIEVPMWFSLQCYIHNTLWTYLLQLFLSHCYVYNMGYKYNNISDEIQQCYIHKNLWTYLLQLLL